VEANGYMPSMIGLAINIVAWPSNYHQRISHLRSQEQAIRVEFKLREYFNLENLRINSHEGYIIALSKLISKSGCLIVARFIALCNEFSIVYWVNLCREASYSRL
jgi:hypothetical protein